MAQLLTQVDENKNILDSFKPFEGELLEEIKSFYRIGQVYSSNAIEGFSYTESETKILLEDGLTAGGKPLRDMYAVLGHAEAYDYMFNLLNVKEMAENDILVFHSLLKGSLDNQAVPGEYRQKQVLISGSKYALSKWENIPDEMRELFSVLKQKREKIHPVLLAAWLHKNIAFIHPFADGNGRVARLAMNTIMIQYRFLPTIIPPILRQEYISSLEKSRKNEGVFYDFIAKCQLETQKDMIRLLKGNEIKGNKVKKPMKT